MSERMTVEVIQTSHALEDVDQNIERMVRSIENSQSDLMIFPEMFMTGYTLGRKVHSISFSVNDHVFDPIIDSAGRKGKHLVFGFPRRSDIIKGQIHNSAMIIGPHGVIGTYDKMHLVDFGPFEEWAYYTPGDKPLIFELNGFRLGIIICYDIFFPELTKYYALNGADAVICISASPSMTREFFESVMRARAIESTVYFIYSNLVGFDSRMDFWGGSEIIDPRGRTVAKGPYFEEGSIKGQIESDVIRLARYNRPTLRDTRTDIFL